MVRQWRYVQREAPHCGQSSSHDPIDDSWCSRRASLTITPPCAKDPKSLPRSLTSLCGFAFDRSWLVVLYTLTRAFVHVLNARCDMLSWTGSSKCGVQIKMLMPDRKHHCVGMCWFSAATIPLALAAGACSLKTPKGESQASHVPGSSVVLANLVIINARIWTGAEGGARPGDPAEPTAVAIAGDKIVAVGDDATVHSFIGPQTKVIDAGGRRVIPGITDCHTHAISGGLHLARLNLRDVRNRNEFIQAIADDAKTKAKGQWVLGGRWSVESWPRTEQPDKSWIDPVTGDTPVYLSRMDGHQALVNSAALRLAGIDASGPPDPKGGEIERDPRTREPTGILKESAADLVSDLIPDPTPAEYDAALRRAMKHANSLGVTSVNDMSLPEHLEVFHRAEERDELTIRITSYMYEEDWAKCISKFPSYKLDSDMLRLVGLKGFMDGSLGSRTAYMREPYSDNSPDEPYPRGQLTAMADPPEKFQDLVARADAKGLQLAVHAIGDEGNHLLLDAYEAAQRRNGPHDARHRVEHAQHLLVEDIPRFAKLGVVASMQPLHKADDGRYAEQAIGKERLRGSYAYRQLVDAGALVVFGSDWPVVSLNPFLGIDSAVNARTLAGEVWLPSHSLTVEEALRAYTVLPPRAVHRGKVLGIIEPGKLADLVVLDQDLLTIPTDRLRDVGIVQTIVAGRMVFDSSDG